MTSVPRYSDKFLSLIRTGGLGILIYLCGASLNARGALIPFTFADGQITCELHTPGESPPEEVETVLPIAMKVAIQEVGLPSQPAHLNIQLEAKPSILQRIRSLFRAEAFAIQEGDTLRVRLAENPLKLAFRMAHEFSHWLVFKQYGARPPLWLDEGLANEVGAAAAAVLARTQSQKLERPRPSGLGQTAYTLEELTTLREYPRSEARIAAFYWQAEALVHALRKRLGNHQFKVYLELLASPDAPDWQEPLRERWYFSDGDFERLAQQIQAPSPTLQPSSP